MDEDFCKLRAFAFGLIFGIALVILIAWDRIVYVH